MESKNLVISTGNILAVNRKAGQKAAEELFDCLKTTLADQASHSKAGRIYRNNDDLHAKMTEFDRCDIKIGVKIFINNDSEELMKSAIDTLLQTLNVDFVDNLILAYHPQVMANGTAHHENGESAMTNGSSSAEPKEGVLEWGIGNTRALENLKKLWKILEEYSKQEKLCQLGIADLDTDSLIELYEHCTVKPAIAQINLSACCVVPPSMQEFCNKHDIQLLTHSDPEEIITKSTMNELNLTNFKTSWTTRYQVHVKCRGVLTAKGFILGAERK